MIHKIKITWDTNEKQIDNAWSGVKDGIKNKITWKSMTTNEVREIKMALNEINKKSNEKGWNETGMALHERQHEIKMALK